MEFIVRKENNKTYSFISKEDIKYEIIKNKNRYELKDNRGIIKYFILENKKDLNIYNLSNNNNGALLYSKFINEKVKKITLDNLYIKDLLEKIYYKTVYSFKTIYGDTTLYYDNDILLIYINKLLAIKRDNTGLYILNNFPDIEFALILYFAALSIISFKEGDMFDI